MGMVTMYTGVVSGCCCKEVYRYPHNNCDHTCRNQPYGAICNFSLRVILSLGGCFAVLFFFLSKTMGYSYGIYVPSFTAVGPSFQP